MAAYVLKRLLLMIPTLFGVAVLVFLMLRVAPGDVVELKYAGSVTFAPRAAIERERAERHLPRGLLVDERHCGDLALRVAEDLPRLLVLRPPSGQAQQPGHDLEVVLHAMVNLLKQNFLFLQ